MTKSERNVEIVDYIWLTVGTIILDIGVYVFKFPNNFTFGGVTGIAMILAKIGSLTPATYNLIINVALLVLGFIFLGKSFGVKTVYVSMLNSLLLELMEHVFPMDGPLTNQPVLELIFAIILPSVGAAIFFNRGASGGGTDIVAMIVKKYTSFNIGTALFFVDLSITICACFVFDVTTGLFAFTGLMAKSLVIDQVIENINLCKYFTIICDDPEPICKYITDVLKKSATVFKAEGAYAHSEKTVILSVMRRSQAVMLRNYVRHNHPNSFIMITNSSEIIGKGFRGFN
ncbi:MAG: YitT family protein [Lachnospiraceae bacterium]|nr:YitT family protein [Lachnospiraceae bacterium]